MVTPQKTANGHHKYFEDQFDDEEVQMVFRKHPIVMRKGFIISMVLWLVGPVIMLILTFVHPDSPPSIPTFFASLFGSIALGIIALIPSWIGWYFSVYIVTDQRFIQVTQKGFFTKSVVDISLDQIQMVNYEIVGMQETLLGFGTIRVQTYVGELAIHDVHHPAKTAKKLQLTLRDLGINTATLQ
jgi:membrane protein YdbS with pleckstrin-like domain